MFFFSKFRSSAVGKILRSLLAAGVLFSCCTALAQHSPEDLLAAGRADEAVQLLQEHIHEAPTAESYNQLCRAEYQLGAWEAGVAACEKATKLAPENGTYHLWLGRVYGEKAEHTNFLSAMRLAKKVVAEFQRAVELAPESCESRADLAEFYVEAPGVVGGGQNKARAEAERLAKLNPAMADWVKARLAEKNNDLVAAEQEYREAIQASGGGARELLNLAGFYSHNQRFEEMDRVLRNLETSQRNHPDALVDGAAMLIRTGMDSPLAIALLQRYLTTAVEAAPAFQAHAMLGELLERQGNVAAAAQEYRASLSMAHNYRLAQDGLKRVTS